MAKTTKSKETTKKSQVKEEAKKAKSSKKTTETKVKAKETKVKKEAKVTKKATEETAKAEVKETKPVEETTKSTEVVAEVPQHEFKRIEGDKAPTTMEELLAMTGYQLKAPKRGDVVGGVITDVNKHMVLVDIGAKTEGMVVDQEYEATMDLISDLHVGDKVSVYVISPENDRGQILLSLKRAATDRKWEQFTEFMETGKVVAVKGLEINRGGMIVAVDTLRGFVPSSQFGKEYLGKMEKLLNRDFDVKVIEVDKIKNRLIFSEREVSEAQAIQNRNRALDVIKVGDIYEGVVSGIMPFGAFVTVTVPLEGEKEKIGQVEGLVHISEISWEKVNDPNDYFTQGDRVKVKVLGIDNGKLNLSVKQLTDDPWKNILKKYEVGTTVKGRVTRVEPFGVFVTLEPGVDGLIHISKIDAGHEPEVGKEIDVIVDSVDVDNRRMSLGVVLTEVPVGYK